MNLQSNDFELFGVPEQFAQDLARIDERWKELQREAHPDRFAAQGAAAQRIAMQWSVRINEAYRRLKDPLARAAYLCELRGAPIEAEKNTAMPAEFLVEQMEWREALDEAAGEEELEDLSERVASKRRECGAGCGVEPGDSWIALFPPRFLLPWISMTEFKKTAILETPRLRLREMSLGDLDFVAAMLSHPEVMRFYPKLHSRQEATLWIERQLDRYEFGVAKPPA